MTREEYKGWNIVAQPQRHPKFPRFMAMASRLVRGRREGFNVEGHSIAEVRVMAKQRIDNKETTDGRSNQTDSPGDRARQRRKSRRRAGGSKSRKS